MTGVPDKAVESVRSDWGAIFGCGWRRNAKVGHLVGRTCIDSAYRRDVVVRARNLAASVGECAPSLLGTLPARSEKIDARDCTRSCVAFDL